jgi:PAS domain S-box-containing protein
MTKDEYPVKLKQKSESTENDLRYFSSKYKESFFLIFENCPYPIFLINKKGMVENSNLAAVKLLKGNRKDEIKDKPFKGLLKKSSRGSFEKRFNFFMKNDHKKFESKLVFKDKRNADITCSALLVKDNSDSNNRIVLFAHDITELKKAKKVSESKSNLLTSLLDNIPDHIFFKDKNSRFIRVNKAKAAKAGKEEDFFIGKTDFDFFPKDEAEEMLKDEKQIIAKGKPIIEKEQKVTRPDGKEEWFLVTKVPSYDRKGNVIGTLGISKNITEKKKLEEKLKERVEKLGEEVVLKSNLLTSLLDNTPDNIYFKDKKSRFVAVSKSLSKWIGASSSAEMIGKTDFDYFTKEHAEQAYRDEQKIIKTGKPIEGKIEKETHSDGRITWVSTTKIPRYDEKGRVIGTLGISRDVTEKIKLEEKLKERLGQLGEEVVLKSNLLTSLLDNIPDRIYFKDKKSRFVQASKSVANQFGVKSVDELIGKTDSDYFTKEHAELAYRDEQEIIKTGKPIEGKIEKETHPDGRITWASTTKIPRYDEEGNIIGILGISRDITKRKELEEKLKERLEELGEEVLFKSRLLTSLLDNMPDRIYFKDERSRFIAVSESLVQWLGAINAEEMIRKTDFDYFTKEHADQAYIDEQEIIKTGKPVEGKIEKETHSDGRINWVSTTKIPRYDEEGNVIGTLGISRDITDKVLAEKKLEESANQLKTIVNAVSEGLAIVDENHKILEANEFLFELFGLKREKVINKKCHKIFAPWEETCKKCPLKKLFEKNEGSPVIEKTKVSKNGTIRYFSIQCYPIPNYNEKKLKSVISIRDITERKNMEKKNIQNYKRKMKNLSHKLTLAEERERKRIATDLHADIGQTLAFLKIKIGELKEKNTSSNIQKSLEEFYNLVQNAITSARSLMSQISPTILYELGFVPAVDWLAESILKENDIEYEFSDDGKEKPLTDDLRILLFQAVRELLTNIRKHAKAKKVKISIKRNKENIQIEIEDNGIGFDISALDSYCEKDVGFGLLNIRSRIDVVGGSFEIESQKKRGTKIILKAPINI